MMLEPVNIAEGRLDPAAFRRYEASLDYTKEIGLLTIGDQKMVSASAWWDPAFGKNGGDSSVLAVVYTDETGCYWLHRIAYLKCDPRSDVDEAAQQCQQVAQILKELFVPSVALETNGIGQFLPKIL